MFKHPFVIAPMAGLHGIFGTLKDTGGHGAIPDG
jgi:hypothetical protein